LWTALVDGNSRDGFDRNKLRDGRWIYGLACRRSPTATWSCARGSASGGGRAHLLFPRNPLGRLGSLAAAEIISHIGARPEAKLADLARAAGLLA